MSNLVTFKSANLPSVTSLATTLRSIAVDAGPVGTVFIRMDKTGHWVFGSEQTEVEDGSTWAINPFSFTHGYIAWGGDKTPAQGSVLGEMMVAINDPLPELPPSPEHATKGWEAQIGVSMRCLSGEDEGLEGRYTTTSKGGKRALQELAVAIAKQVDKDQTKPVPVVHLKKSHYQHKSYGKTIVPVFEILDWVSMDGANDSADEPEAAEAPAAEAAPAGRRRRG